MKKYKAWYGLIVARDFQIIEEEDEIDAVMKAQELAWRYYGSEIERGSYSQKDLDYWVEEIFEHYIIQTVKKNNE